MLSQLDDMLRRLLVRRVRGMADDRVGFDPPDDTWVNKLGTEPALNTYLVEVRENRKLRSNARTRVYDHGWVAQVPAPSRMDCHYLISAWSPASALLTPTQDEHALLYATTVALTDAAPLNAARIYAGGPVAPAWPPVYQRFFDSDLPTEVGPAEGFPKYAEFWGTMGQGRPWRPVVHLVVTVPVVPDEPAVYGPPVTTIRTTTGIAKQGEDVLIDDGETGHLVGGTVRDSAGGPVPHAWVAVETDAGLRLGTDRTEADGRFEFAGLRAGRHRFRYASPRRPARSVDVDVPTETGRYDLTFPA